MAKEKNLKGLSSDTRPLEQPEGTYPFGKNGIQYDIKGAVINEPGFDPTSVSAPGDVNGIIETDGPAVVFSVDEINNISYVGLYDRKTNSYKAVKNDSAFPASDKWNFRKDNYITGEFQRNFKNEAIAAWTDKNQPPRMLNLDNNSDITSAKDTLLFLQATTPTIDTNLDSGGVLEKGAVFVAAKYLKNDGSETGYLAISAPTIVSSSQSGTITDQALNITISNMDQSYDKVQLAIITRNNGTYKAETLDPQEIVPGSLTILYTGENLTTPITLDEVLVPNPVYSKVGTIGQLNDALYIADLEKEPEINLQQYASLVKLRVKSELISVIPSVPEHVSGKKRSLMHQEVYAAYIRYHKTSGGWTKAFHIPGNVPTSGDLDLATSPHETALASKVFHTQDTTRNVDLVNKTMDTGIWQNEDEVYPNTDDFNSTLIGGTDLRGLSVRHHRMPSLRFCKDNLYPGEAEYGKTKMDLLGLEVSNVLIPPSLTGTIDGYEILIAKRTLANSTVLGQSILLVAAQPNTMHGTERGYTSTGGNFTATATGDKSVKIRIHPSDKKALLLTGRDWAAATHIPDADLNAVGKPKLRFRFHAFDMLFNKPAVTPAYLSPQWKMRVNGLDTLYPTGWYIEDGTNKDGARCPVMFICDYTKGTTPTTVASTQRVRVVENTRYLTNGATTGEWDNTDLEGAYVGNIQWQGADTDATNNDLPLSVDISTVNFHNFQHDAQRPRWEETYLMNLMDHKKNLYSSFFAQPLVASGTFVSIDTQTAVVFTGDTFLSEYTFHTFGLFNSENHPGDDNPDPEKLGGYKIVHRIICESVSNINLRYEIEGNAQSRYWPKSPLTAQPVDMSAYLFSIARNQEPNQFGYSKDLNTLNDFGNYSCFNPYLDDVTSMPFRIHRGGKLPRQGKTRSWRTFLPLDYYEAQKNRGRIVRVLGKADRLLIHHENALFQTQDKTKLESGLLSVTLGSGDIFQFEPQEAMASKQGYAGTQHELAAVDTPWGYIFPDAKQGQLFIFRDGVKLINQGLNKFLSQYLKVEDKNPFIGNGITVGYDPDYKRVLVTVKNVQLSADLSSFVPDYTPTTDYFSGLVANTSIVYKNGRFQKFLGVNATEYDCVNNTIPTGVNGSTTIAENTASGTVVANINTQFTDADSDPLTYTLIGGNLGAAFTLNPSTGILKVNNSIMLDYEARTSFSLVIRASDPHGAYVDITYTVALTNVNEPPLVHDYEWTVDENVANTTSVGQVIGTDPEGEAVTYTLLSTGTPFSVNSTTGVVTVSDNTLLDYETQQFWPLQVKAQDPEGLFSISNILVRVNNVNEAPVGSNASATVYKDTASAGDIVHTMSYDDPDGDPITVTWLNQAAFSDKFSFDDNTKQVTLVSPAALNAGEVYTLNFEVDDVAGLSTTFSLTVTVAVATLTFDTGDYVCLSASCTSGDTLAPDSSYCYHYSDTPATPPSGGTPITTEARSSGSYGWAGTLVYDSGYASDGTGTYTKLDTTNAFWRNIPANTSDGPLNRCGLWGAGMRDGFSVDQPTGTPIGFTISVAIPTSKTYYVGIAGDNRCQIKVDGVTVVSQDIAAIQSNVSTIEGTGYTAQVTFNFWHVYPVVLTAGQHYIEVTGINDGSIGSFGAEIYNNTLTELGAATSYTDLDLIFSTKDYRGAELQLGGTVAWTCPSGYSLYATGGTPAYACRQIVTSAPVDANTKHWMTIQVKDGDGNVLAVLNNQPGQTYMGQAVTYQPDETDSVDCGFIGPR
jgi:hypothetical protein